MTDPQHTIAAQLAALPSMRMTELWALWDQHFPRRPSHHNRNYVESRLAYRIQEQAYGALPTNVRKMLVEAGAKHSKIKTHVGRGTQTLLMPGTTLIREWEEREYRVRSRRRGCTPSMVTSSRYKMLHNRVYLGEIVHKGQSFTGQHPAIITSAQWDAVHALIATDGVERRRETHDRMREPVLLRGLLFTPDGERLVPSFTVKRGKTYRYYTPVKHRRFGSWASQHGSLPAGPIEALVVEQIVAALSAPHVVQSVWDRIRETRPEMSEAEVVLPMRRLATMWPQLFPAEQCRLAQLLIERVVIADGGLEVFWRDQGWPELAAELAPGTIGAELQELEETL